MRKKNSKQSKMNWRKTKTLSDATLPIRVNTNMKLSIKIGFQRTLLLFVLKFKLRPNNSIPPSTSVNGLFNAFRVWISQFFIENINPILIKPIEFPSFTHSWAH